MTINEEPKEVTISVKLKNGSLFENKKVPNRTEDDLVCFFTYKRKMLRCYPICEVEYFEFHNLQEKD